MMARVWFDKTDEARPWRLEYDNAERTRARRIEFRLGNTEFKTEGLDLPGGPRGIIHAEISATTDEVPA